MVSYLLRQWAESLLFRRQRFGKDSLPLSLSIIIYTDFIFSCKSEQLTEKIKKQRMRAYGGTNNHYSQQRK